MLVQIYLNNFLLAAAVIASGNLFLKVKRMFDITGIHFLRETSFYNLQKNVVCPGLDKLWKKHGEHCISRMPDGAVVCGDGRCDFPGHSAKLLVYPIMDHSSGLIYHLEFCDKRHVCWWQGIFCPYFYWCSVHVHVTVFWKRCEPLTNCMGPSLTTLYQSLQVVCLFITGWRPLTDNGESGVPCSIALSYRWHEERCEGGCHRRFNIRSKDDS